MQTKRWYHFRQETNAIAQLLSTCSDGLNDEKNSKPRFAYVGISNPTTNLTYDLVEIEDAMKINVRYNTVYVIYLVNWINLATPIRLLVNGPNCNKLFLTQRNKTMSVVCHINC